MTCERHGPSPPTVVCRHLFERSDAFEPLGFITAFDPDEPRPLAWCGECEAVRARDERWTPEGEAFAGWIAVCSHCYEEIRARHLPPP